MLNLIPIITYLITFYFLYNDKSLIYKISFFISNVISIIIDIYDHLKYEQLANSFKEFTKKHYVSSTTISLFEQAYCFSFLNIVLCALYFIYFFSLCRNREKKNSNKIEQKNDKNENENIFIDESAKNN